MFASHPLLKPDAVEERAYQRELGERLAEAPHLLVLPTGLGKTVIALLALLQFLQREPAKRVLFLAPTKPLVDQHVRFLQEALVGIPIAGFTGETPPGERDRRWPEHRVIVATPQVVQNDVVRGRQTLADVSFLIFDEAHRALGNYPYAFLSRRYREAGGQAAAGLTASPGNSTATIHRVMTNLGLERVEVRTESDPDVAPHVHRIETEWVRVRPTLTLLRLVKLLERCYARCALSLRRLGYFQLLKGLPTRKDLVEIGHRLRAEATQPNRGRSVYEAVSLQARALKIQHALELAETQGSPLLYRFLQRIEQEATHPRGSKAARDFLREPEFLEALALARDDRELPPKAAKILELVRQEFSSGARRALVFANYRETAETLVARLAEVPGVRASRFVGHSRAQGERGMTKREQQSIVERFRAGDLNVLVATAVGEEGLDLPETDAVFLHEPVSSGVRMIQRRGRTGRRSDGKVFLLMTEGTRDEAYHWSAVRRERRMRSELHSLRRVSPTLRPPLAAASLPRTESKPARTGTGPVEIMMDPREASGPVGRGLLDRGVTVKTVPLPAGDYAVSQRIVVERKTAQDFAASLRDGRLFDQLPRLARVGLGVLLVEGDPFATPTGFSRSALTGALAAAVADHRTTIVFVPDAEATADFLVSLARREHREGRDGPLRFQKPGFHPESQLRFVLEGLPGVGPVLAGRLLERFGNVAAVVAASPVELQETPGVGPEIARSVHEVFHRPYALGPPAGLAGEGNAGVSAVEGGDGSARGKGLDADRAEPAREFEGAPKGRDEGPFVAPGHA